MHIPNSQQTRMSQNLDSNRFRHWPAAAATTTYQYHCRHHHCRHSFSSISSSSSSSNKLPSVYIAVLHCSAALPCTTAVHRLPSVPPPHRAIIADADDDAAAVADASLAHSRVAVLCLQGLTRALGGRVLRVKVLLNETQCDEMRCDVIVDMQRAVISIH